MSSFRYEDLKPPTSPTPAAPVAKTDLNVVGVSESVPSAQTSSGEVSAEISEANSPPAPVSRPLSPYVA